MYGTVKEIWKYRELLGVLVLRNIRIRYKGSFLGFFWTLLSPLFLIVIYTVFLRILRFPTSLPDLITGVLVWQFLAMCMGDSLQVVLGNAVLVKKTAFPRIILPLSMTLANGINLLLSLAVLFVYLFSAGAPFGAVAWLPVIILTECALCLGVSLIFSAANVFFRDIEHIQHVISMGWFFLTPVVYPLAYPLDIIRRHFQGMTETLFFLNPMAGIVSAYRTVLLSADRASAGQWAVSFAVAWIVCLLGIAFFQRVQGRFADEL